MNHVEIIKNLEEERRDLNILIRIYKKKYRDDLKDYKSSDKRLYDHVQDYMKQTDQSVRASVIAHDLLREGMETSASMPQFKTMISIALIRLVNDGKVTRVARGLYQNKGKLEKIAEQEF
jgi:hypothetical protein